MPLHFSARRDKCDYHLDTLIVARTISSHEVDRKRGRKISADWVVIVRHQFRDRVYQIAHYNWDVGTARAGATDAPRSAITVRPARILFLRNHNSESRYRIELHGDRWPDESRVSRARVDRRGGPSLHAYVHASARASNDNAFSRRCSRRRSSSTDRSSTMRVRVCVHRLVLFTRRPPAARHERSRASGKPPPPVPVHPVTEPPTLDPESTPVRPSSLPRRAFSSAFTFSRFFSASLIVPLSQM